MLTWAVAMRQALYGEGGFYVRGRGADDDFRTSATNPSGLAAALLRLAVDVDAGLDHPARLDVIDVGAGRGTLLVALSELASSCRPGLAGRLRLTGIELAARPPGLPATIGWQATLPQRITGLLVALEWLDVVPVELIEVDPAGEPRLLLVDPADGAERLGGAPSAPDADWLRRWWPLQLATPGERAELGRARDTAWVDAVHRLDCGLAVAIDYDHDRAARAAGRYAAGTLVGYRAGRAVRPIPDGGCDLTAHVALDACAAAAVATGRVRATVLARQASILRALGVCADRPALALATSDPPAYATALAEATALGELLDLRGLGGFGWLLQTVGIDLPPALR